MRCYLALGALALAVDGRDLPGAVPLDGQILERNRVEDGVKFGGDRLLVARSNFPRSPGLGKVIGRTTLLTIGMEIWNRMPAGNTRCPRSVLKTKYEFTASFA